MKTLVALFALTAFAVAQAPAPQQAQQIYVAADRTFRGPFTHAPTPLAGETVNALTAAQFSALNALRSSSGARHFTFDGANFAVAPIDQLAGQLLAIFSGLTPSERALFKPQMDAVKARLAVGDVAGAQLIITLSGSGMPTDIATVRTNMLALITQIYGATPPAVNQ